MNSNIATASEQLSISDLVSLELFIQILNVYAGYRMLLNKISVLSHITWL